MQYFFHNTHVLTAHIQAKRSSSEILTKAECKHAAPILYILHSLIYLFTVYTPEIETKKAFIYCVNVHNCMCQFSKWLHISDVLESKWAVLGMCELINFVRVGIARATDQESS